MDDRKLRQKILPALKLIKFVDITEIEFAKLCVEELGEVMHTDEKDSILTAIVTNKWKLMPTELATPRSKPFTEFDLCFVAYPCAAPIYSSLGHWCGEFLTSLFFKLDNDAELIALKVSPPKFGIETYRMHLYALRGEPVALDLVGKVSLTGDKFNYRNEDYSPFIPKSTLAANICYHLVVNSLYTDEWKDCWLRYGPPELKKKNSITSDGLKVLITSPSLLHINVEKLLFKRLD